MAARHAGGLPTSASRRQILLSGGAGLVGLASGLGRPGLSRAADRPVLTHGLQSGDVGTDAAMVWARSDRPARAVIEWATTESFADIRGGVFADALPETDGTGKVALTGLPPGQDYDPDRAQSQDFDPFWEFVSGPLHAGTFGSNALDDTFGPQLRFVKAPDQGQVNLSPAAGYQFFGHVAVDGATEQMTVTLKDAADTDLWRVTLDPVKA